MELSSCKLSHVYGCFRGCFDFDLPIRNRGFVVSHSDYHKVA